MSESPLSQVPEPSATTLDCRQKTGVAGDALFPRRVHAAASTPRARVAERSRTIQPVVPHCNTAGDRTRSKASRSRDWFLWHSSHVGTELAVPSPHPLRYSGRRNRTGPFTLDSSAVSILLTCESPRKSVPWKIRRRTASGFSEGTSEACRDNPTSQRTKGVCGIPANLVPATLGCLREASLRRTRAGCALSRTLYAPHRDLQSPIDCIRWRSRHIPLEGLRAGQQTTADDGVRRRVHSAISGARSAKRIRSYPSFRFHGECTPVCIAGTVSTIVEHGAGDLFDRCCVRSFRLVLSQLSWTYDCRGTIYGSPVDVEICFGMFFRYFVACNPNLFCFVVLWHIYADVCPLSLVTQSLVHGSSRFHAKHQLKRVHIIRRDRL